jgi:RimJ/RimL family protein N-acetyltransferase
MFHITERLLLRPAWPEDWAEILSGVDDEGVAMNLARVPWPYSEADARWWTTQPQDQCTPSFLVVESASGRVIGSAGLAPGEGEVEIGYWLRRDAWGRGYATEAARGVVEVARMLGHRRVSAGHFADNPASGRVLRKAGLKPTGQVLRRFSLARGVEVDSIEHTLDLDGDCSMPCQRAA